MACSDRCWLKPWLYPLSSSCPLSYEPMPEFEPTTDAASEAAPTTAGTEAAHLRVVYHLSKPCVCMLCSAKSTDPTPLTSSALGLEEAAEDAVSKLPWKCHRKVTDRVTSEQARVPEGRLCLICFNVYRMLGLDAKHGAPKSYVKKVITEKQGNHGNFLATRTKWIEEHNLNPAKARCCAASYNDLGNHVHPRRKADGA